MSGKEEKQTTSENRGRRGLTGRIVPAQNGYKAALLIMAVVAIVFLVMVIILNMLPADLTLTLVLLMLGMLLAAALLFAGRRKWQRICGIVVAALFMVIFIGASSYMGKTHAMLENISDSGISATGPKARSVEVTEEPFNIYITGIDQWESEIGYDLERSDVNMICTVNPRTKKILLTSIPRDTYVKLHTAQQMDKLTHTGVYGVDETLDTVHDWMGVDLNYYVKMNFTGAKDIINAMDGVNMYSPIAFKSSLEDYEYVKGWNAMGGEKCLYYAREREAFGGKDSIRVENQQRVLKAVIKKMTSSTTLLTKYGDIVEAAGRNLATNMPSEDMKKLVKMQISDLSDWDIETQKIEGEYDEDYVASLSQENKYTVYRPDRESVRSCKENIDKVMNEGAGDTAGIRKSKSFFVNAAKRVLEEKD